MQETKANNMAVENKWFNSSLLFLNSEKYFTSPLKVPKTENCSKKFIAFLKLPTRAIPSGPIIIASTFWEITENIILTNTKTAFAEVILCNKLFFNMFSKLHELLK